MSAHHSQVTFLLASSFSGSTLLSRLISERTDSLALGDTYLIPGISDASAICTCTKPIAECDFRVAMCDAYQTTITELFSRSRRFPPAQIARRGGGVRFGRAYQAAERLKVSRLLWSRFVRSEFDFIDTALQISGCAHYFDGSKSLIRAYVMASASPDARIIHLTRDPRDVVVSAITKHGRQTNDPFAIAEDWVAYNSAVLRMFAQRRFYSHVQFSDLVRDPETTMQTVIEAVGAPEGTRNAGSHLIGNRSRLGSKKVSVEASRIDRSKLPNGVESVLQRGIAKHKLHSLDLSQFEAVQK